MEFIEICLIIAGIVCIVASFIFSGAFVEKDEKPVAGGKQDASIDEAALKARVEELVGDSLEDIKEKTEISMEKLSNQKIMEISEYSDTVIAQIKSNHDEAMFLYDMLNSKADSMMKVNPVQPQAVQPKAPQPQTVQYQAPQPQGAQAANTFESGKKAKDKHNKKQSAKPSENSRLRDEQVLLKSSRDRGMSANRDKILELAAMGYSNVDIAKQLGIGIGEVRLIVDLYKSE